MSYLNYVELKERRGPPSAPFLPQSSRHPAGTRLLLGQPTSRAPARRAAIQTLVARAIPHHDAAAVGAGGGILVGAEGEHRAGRVAGGGADRALAAGAGRGTARRGGRSGRAGGDDTAGGGGAAHG